MPRAAGAERADLAISFEGRTDSFPAGKAATRCVFVGPRLDGKKSGGMQAVSVVDSLSAGRQAGRLPWTKGTDGDGPWTGDGRRPHGRRFAGCGMADAIFSGTKPWDTDTPKKKFKSLLRSAEGGTGNERAIAGRGKGAARRDQVWATTAAAQADEMIDLVSLLKSRRTQEAEEG